MIRKQDGQSLVEFALILPILLMLLVGIVDFGRILYTHLHLEMVAQESVRIGGLGQSDKEIRIYAMNQFHGDESKLQVAITPGDSVRKAGDYITVTLSYPEEFMNVLGDAAIPYTVRTNSTIRVE
ncbi:TadE/TadG family type IV pilus assembly protein [Oceanobacillus saliphilus]|uniref:TadE/TadG family type IV pilus assembly protein n=1 Tax=Oceanobacillus saliphilus TaxID=2925834 RepID=UPI00201E3EBC|nr:TadE family protein [Oceanobacillus saliphilus]